MIRRRCSSVRCALCLTLVVLLSLGSWSHAWLQGPSRHCVSRPSRPINIRWAKRITAPRPTQDPASQSPTQPSLLRVVTDIDDTVKSSGNLRLAGLIPLGGIDAQYERGQFYPGVFQFALELAAHGTPQGLLPLPVAVLTARAKEFLFALELKTEHPVSIAYRQCGTDNGFDGWGLGPVLYGSVKEWIVWTRKGRRKFKNFKRLMEIDGTHAAARGCATDYIFIGDTGEGDTKAGVKMCETFPRELRAMFMHAVSCDSEYCITPDDYTINGVPVLFFKTYVGAARKAYEAGLMDKAGVQRVIDRSVMELELSGAPRDCSKWEDMEMDIEQALMTIYPDHEPIPNPLTMMESHTHMAPAGRIVPLLQQ